VKDRGLRALLGGVGLLGVALTACTRGRESGPSVLAADARARAAALGAIATFAPTVPDAGADGALCVAFEAPGPPALGLVLPVQTDPDAAFLTAARRTLPRRVVPASACVRDSSGYRRPIRERASGQRAVLVALGPVTWAADSSASVPAWYYADDMLGASFTCRAPSGGPRGAVCTVTSISAAPDSHAPARLLANVALQPTGRSKHEVSPWGRSRPLSIIARAQLAPRS
jgi:hypothetical protein